MCFSNLDQANSLLSKGSPKQAVWVSDLHPAVRPSVCMAYAFNNDYRWWPVINSPANGLYASLRDVSGEEPTGAILAILYIFKLQIKYISQNMHASLLCFILLRWYYNFLEDSYDLSNQNLQGYFTGTGAMIEMWSPAPTASLYI